MTTSIDAQQYIVRSDFESPRSAGTTTRSLRAIDQDASREKWDRCYAFLKKAKHLNANWDGDGAAPPRADVIDSLIFYFQYYLEKTANFPGPTRFAITPDGAVFVEWQEPGIYMDLECSEPGQAEFLTIESDTPPTHDLIRWSIPMVATAPTAIVAIPFGFEEGSRSAAFSIGPIELRPTA